MEGKSGEKDCSHRGDKEKDSRRAKKREEEAKAHHTWYQRTGPNVIVRTQLGGSEMTSETTDSFDVTCDNVAHSLNKGKRWEMAENSEQILLEKNLPGKISFVETSVPGNPGRSQMRLEEADINHRALMANKGGVKKYVEMENGEISVRKAKSDRANIKSLQSNLGPNSRQKQSNAKKADGATKSQPSAEELHTRYSTLELGKRDPKSCQNQRSSKQGWTRKHVNDDMLDGNSEEQDALEDELDAYYEEQLDSEDSLVLPDHKEVKVEKQPEPATKIVEKNEEFSPEEALLLKKKAENIPAIDEEYGNPLIELRPPLMHAQHTETLFENAKKHFNKGGPCLAVFPRTIIVHKAESEKILGTEMTKCTFVAASNVAGEVILYAAPGFCCAAAPAMSVGGLQSQSKDEFEKIADGDIVVPSDSLSVCAHCNKTGEIEGLTDTAHPPRLFAFSCGHMACQLCWLAHAKRNATEKNTVITCVNPHCRHVPSVSEASALFSDSTIGNMRVYWWNSLCNEEGSVPCYSCHRILVPLNPDYPAAAALCRCGARTCIRCGHREHLPLSCSLYDSWANRFNSGGYGFWIKNVYDRRPTREVPSTKKRNCWRCGAEDTITWKNWCEKCAPNLPVRFRALDRVEGGDVHGARRRIINSDYHIDNLARDMSRETAEEMDKIVQDGVHLYEVININCVLGGEESGLGRYTNRRAQDTLGKLERGLNSVLFAAIERDGDLQKKSEELKKYIEAIRLKYSMAAAPISQNAEFLQQWRSTLNNEVLKSPCTPVPIPEETLIARILRSLKVHASKYPEKHAVIEALDHDRSLTYQQVHDRALSFAAFLASRGFGMGDRLTAALPNSIEWPVLHLGTWTVGGAVVGSSAAFKLFETVYQLQDSASSFVVVSEELLDTFIEAAKQCASVKTIICVRSTDKPLPEGIIDFVDTVQYQPLEKIADVTLDTVCMIYYSSGTTGQPKGIIHTHRTFHCQVEVLRSHWLHEIYPVLGVNEVDAYKENQIVNSACYHILGFTQVNWFLITGSPMVLMKAFDGDVYLDIIDKFKPRFIIVAPPIFAYLAKDVKERKAAIESVQMIMCSTAPLSQEVSDAFLATHPNVKYIVQGYGMTEIGCSHAPFLLHEGANASGGVVSSYFEQKIIDTETLKPCKQGQRGEVCVRGASQTIGYLNKPEATKGLIDEEGWIHTGDVGYVDERGLLYIVDRLKELIKVNYMNQTLQVPPAELEGILLSNHRIRDAAIVGIPDATSGELVRAYVVKGDEQLSGQEVENLIADKLAEYKRITGGVVFVDAIPRSAGGKILRRVLREVNGA